MTFPANQSLNQHEGPDKPSNTGPALYGSAFLSTILEQMPDAVLALDSAWHITYCNHQAQCLLEQSGTELLGRSLWEALPQAQDTPFYQNCQQAKTTGKALSCDYLAPLVNRWFHVLIAPSAAGVYLYFQNNTECKHAEDLLRQSEQRFRAIFNQSFTFLGVMTPNGRLVDVNELALTASGFHREEVLGLPFWETGWWRFLPQEASRMQAAIDRASSGQTVRFECATSRVMGPNDGLERPSNRSSMMQGGGACDR